MNKKCAVLINSCDKYEDAWYPFFHFMKKNWKDCNFPIYLSTEAKTYIDESLKINMLNCYKKNVSWSERLKIVLKRIPNEYIIFLLEDFFLLSEVNDQEINNCISQMESNKRISVISFEYDPKNISEKSPFSGYCIRKKDGCYYLNCQAALWRRKDLIKFLNPYESPWQFELYGTERAKLYNKMFLLCNHGTPPVFHYSFKLSDGYGIHDGKWLRSNVELFQKEGIHVDYDKMGICKTEHYGPQCVPPKKNFKWKLMYLLYGGGEEPRTDILTQLKYVFTNPKLFFKMLKNKYNFIIKKSLG